jgi:signal-transduction protein with cAMP-binding, CBS, and nucleotidyltransferase domain
MKVGDFMSTPVETIHPDSPIMDAAQLMLKRHFSGLPVVDDNGRVVGIVTEHDLLRRTDRPGSQQPYWLQQMIERAAIAKESVRFDGAKVKEVMTSDPFVVMEDTPIDDVCHMMQQRSIKRLPVVRDGRLVGIVSRADLVRALATAIHLLTQANEHQAATGSLMVELQRQSMVNRARSPI